MIQVTDNMAELLREIGAFARDVRDGLDLAVSDACEDGADEARRVAPEKTGALRGSIRGRFLRRGEGEIVALAKHATYVEEDTKPHEIRARRAATLRWEDGDGVHFAQRVQHPGTKGQPFMGPAYFKAERVLIARGEVLLAKASRRFS